MIGRIQLPVLALPAPQPGPRLGQGTRRDEREVASEAIGDSRRGAAPDARSSGEAVSRRSNRPDPAFLAQIIATRDGLPQTRGRRQAEPEVALGAYRRAAALLDETGPCGRAVRI